jgi:hypothetical protein
MDKTIGRSLTNLINPNNFPSPCDYSPKYDVTRNSITNQIHFLREDDPEKMKKFAFKKILYSYDQSSDYRSAQVKNLIDLQIQHKKHKKF